MDQRMEPPIEYFRTQKASKVDETMPTEFNTLIQAYEAVRRGHITDVETIRVIARQLEAIADMPESSDSFPYEADQMAVALYRKVLEIDMKAKTGTSGQISSHVNITEQSPPKFTDEITVDFVKISEEILNEFGIDGKNTPILDKRQYLDQAQTKESDRQTQERIKEILGIPIIADHDPAKRPKSNSGIREEINTSPERPVYLASISDQWAALLKFMEIAEQEEKELTEKGIVKGPIDHNDLWKEWKE